MLDGVVAALGVWRLASGNGIQYVITDCRLPTNSRFDQIHTTMALCRRWLFGSKSINAGQLLHPGRS